jgi:hypothetical protein
VTGPGSSTTGHIATYADGTGKVIQDGGVLGSIAALSALSAQYLAGSAIAFGLTMVNGTFNISNAGNALTIAIKTLAGSDPSSSDPTFFVFRGTGASGGTYSVIGVNAALNVTIPYNAGSPNTLGSSNNTPFRIWVVAINNAGTVELALINCLSGTSIYPLGQNLTTNTTAFGGGGANAAQTFYATNSRSNVVYNVLGHFTYEAGGTLATAGTWNANPGTVRLYVPGNMPLPGGEVQRVRTATGAYQSGSTVFATADSIPTNTAGDQYMSQMITPASSANVLEIDARAVFSEASAGGREGMGLFQDATASALAAAYFDAQAANLMYAMDVRHEMQAGTVSSTTFKIRMGNASGNVTQFNGISGARTLGGVANSFIRAGDHGVMRSAIRATHCGNE